MRVLGLMPVRDARSSPKRRVPGSSRSGGYHYNAFGSAYQTDRAGVRRWSRLEAHCPAPDRDVKFVLGPVYWRSEPWAQGTLIAWQSSYMNKIARASHPQDYDFVSIDGKPLQVHSN